MQNFVETILSALSQAGVEFIVVGGVSAVLQGAPLVTQDLGLCYRRTPDNVKRLARALAPFKPRLRGLPPEFPSLVDEHTLALGDLIRTKRAAGRAKDLAAIPLLEATLARKTGKDKSE